MHYWKRGSTIGFYAISKGLIQNTSSYYSKHFCLTTLEKLKLRPFRQTNGQTSTTND